jgi:hypothetical protein
VEVKNYKEQPMNFARAETIGAAALKTLVFSAPSLENQVDGLKLLP